MGSWTPSLASLAAAAEGEEGLEHRLLSVLTVSDSRLSRGYRRSFWKELGPHFQRRRRESWQRAHQLSLFWNAGRAVVFAQKGFEKGTLHTNFLSFFFYVLSTFSLLPGHVVASEKLLFTSWSRSWSLIMREVFGSFLAINNHVVFLKNDFSVVRR